MYTTPMDGLHVVHLAKPTDYIRVCFRAQGEKRLADDLIRLSFAEPEHILLREAQQALVRTFADLHRTVSVRDADISIDGAVSRRMAPIDHAPQAGAALPAWCHDDIGFALVAAVGRIGGAHPARTAIEILDEASARR